MRKPSGKDEKEDRRAVSELPQNFVVSATALIYANKMTGYINLSRTLSISYGRNSGSASMSATIILLENFYSQI
jgi:hypothetical protein